MLAIARITRRSVWLLATMASSVCWGCEEEQLLPTYNLLAVNRPLSREMQDQHRWGAISLQGTVPLMLRGTLFQLHSTSSLSLLQARVAGSCRWRFLG